MTGGDNEGSGGYSEYTDAPSRTVPDIPTTPREELATLPDGISASSVPCLGFAALSAGTFNIASVDDDEGDGVLSSRRPFSGVWTHEADQSQASEAPPTAGEPALNADNLHLKFESPLFVARSPEVLSTQASPGSVVRSSTADLDRELEEVLGGQPVVGAPCNDERSGSSTLLDAADDDQTDPQVPRARRLSERPRMQSVSPTESGAPPPVAVTVPPPEDVAAAMDSGDPPSNREVWWAAAAAVGTAAAAALIVLIVADVYWSSDNEKAVTAAQLPANVAGVSEARLTAAAPRDGAAQARREPVTPPQASPARHVAARSSTQAFTHQPIQSPIAEPPRAPRSALSASTPPQAERMRREALQADGRGSNGATDSFDRDMARQALDAAAARASACRQPGDPSGVARVLVTFAPNSGRVTQAIVTGQPFQGTETGGCIARAIRGATVPPFTGPRVTVAKTVVVQ